MLNILLSEPNFSTAEQVAGAINREIHGVSARVRDSRRIEVERGPDAGDVPGLLAHIENLSVEVHRRARVIINERTGTIVMGREVRLGAVSILQVCRLAAPAARLRRNQGCARDQRAGRGD